MFQKQALYFCAGTSSTFAFILAAMPSKPGMASNETHLAPKQLAAAAGVSVDTLRFYERRGLLPRVPRTSSGRRVYPGAALKRVQMVRGALSLGFTVDELREILQLRDRGGKPCGQVCELAEAKIVKLEAEIARLEAVRKVLRSTVTSWRRDLTAARGNRAGLLERFAETHPESVRQVSPMLAAGLHRRMSR
jgi:DNA-binding transcriptional MerR regulator